MDEPEEQPKGDFLSMVFGESPDPMAFNFNCPIDWIPRADLP